MVAKKCRLCGQTKAITEFHRRGGSRKGYQADCKECTSKRFREEGRRKREELTNLKLQRGCEECGYREDPSKLHFHHIDPKTKGGYGDSHSYDANWSMQRIKEELEKCVVLCGKCHLHAHNYHR